MRATRVVREASTAALPPAPGAEQYLAVDFADSAYVLPGGHFIDLLGTPESANRWLAERGLAPADAGVQEMCATQLRVLREHIRALFAARVAQQPVLPAALSAVNDALSRTPTAALLQWDEANGFYRTALCPPNVDRALATLAADAADLLSGSGADFLTTCESVPCNRYLIRHGRRHWCSTRCGDRARAARAYARAKSKTD